MAYWIIRNCGGTKTLFFSDAWQSEMSKISLWVDEVSTVNFNRSRDNESEINIRLIYERVTKVATRFMPCSSSARHFVCFVDEQFAQAVFWFSLIEHILPNHIKHHRMLNWWTFYCSTNRRFVPTNFPPKRNRIRWIFFSAVCVKNCVDCDNQSNEQYDLLVVAIWCGI